MTRLRNRVKINQGQWISMIWQLFIVSRVIIKRRERCLRNSFRCLSMMPICSETSEKSLVSSYHHIISAIGELKKKRSADIRKKNAEKSLRNNN